MRRHAGPPGFDGRRITAVNNGVVNGLSTERDGPILRVWLDRPDKLNPLNTETLEALATVFSMVNQDFDVQLVVLAGRGRSFSAGADRKASPGGERMSVASGAGDRERRWYSQIGHRACAAIINCEVPTIARIQGWCVGGGLALALACDFRIAGDDARFSIPEVDLGIPLAWGATPRLISEIGASRARELILMCTEVDGVEATRLGLVHRCVPLADLDAEVQAWAQRLVAKPQIAVSEARSQFRAYAHAGVLGDVTQTDGDLMMQASRGPVAQAAFGGLD